MISKILQKIVILVIIGINMPKILEKRLIEEFKDREFFTRDDLFKFYRYFEPDLNEGTFGWRIHDLKGKNIIRTVKRGHYVISDKPKYKPEASIKIVELAKHITNKYKDINYCIWETEWLNEFTQHQAALNMIIIEIEKDLIESLYYELKDSFKNDMYLDPDDKAIIFYVSESNDPVVIKKLITRSPVASRTEKKVKFYTPLLEKILVDLFADEELFYHVQGSELMHIYENAISNYTINFTKLFSYAKRRDREQEIKQFVTNHLCHLVGDIIE